MISRYVPFRAFIVLKLAEGTGHDSRFLGLFSSNVKNDSGKKLAACSCLYRSSHNYRLAQIDYWQKFRTSREVGRFTSYLTISGFAWPSGRDNVSIYTGTSVHTDDVASVADCSVSWPDEFALHFGRCHRSFS